MAGAERTSCALTMDTYHSLDAVDDVIFELCDVMADVIDELKAEFAWTNPERLYEGVRRQVHHDLAVTPCEVGCRCHRAQVVLSLWRGDGHGRKLLVGKDNLVLCHRRADYPQVIVAGLMAEPAGAGMNQEGNLPKFESQRLGNARLVDLVDPADLQKMIA